MNKTLKYTKFLCGLALFFVLFSVLTLFARADEFTATNFKVLDPVLFPAGYSTSTDYQLLSTIGQTAVGTSTASSFNVSGGFLYFPFVTTPVVFATSGDGKVDLSWTSASSGVGWTVGGYNVGQSATSGGPYTFTSVGNVTSSSRTGLSNSAVYYFVIQVKDALDNVIATSLPVSATPTTPTPTPSDGGGSGGGGSYVAPVTSVVFSGRAYPGRKVTLLKDAQIAASVLADPNAAFSISLSGLSSGNYNFGIYSEDSAGRKSPLVTYPVSITSGATIQVGGIFIAPTIATDKSEVKRGDNIAIFGQSAPKADVTIAVNSDEEFFGKAAADANGVYLYNFDTAQLDKGQHFTKSKASLDGAISSFSKAIGFTVRDKTISAQLPQVLKGDVNSDKRVNLVDFSIAAYWYRRPSPPASIDLNGDGKVDLIDFSIMAFYWTG